MNCQCGSIELLFFIDFTIDSEIMNCVGARQVVLVSSNLIKFVRGDTSSTGRITSQKNSETSRLWFQKIIYSRPLTKRVFIFDLIKVFAFDCQSFRPTTVVRMDFYRYIERNQQFCVGDSFRSVGKSPCMFSDINADELDFCQV